MCEMVKSLSLKSKGFGFRAYSVVFVCRGRRGWWRLCQGLPGASQVLGARVVG